MRTRFSWKEIDNDLVIVNSEEMDYRHNQEDVWYIELKRTQKEMQQKKPRKEYFFFQEDLSCEEALELALFWESVSINDVQMIDYKFDMDNPKNVYFLYKVITSIGQFNVGYTINCDSLYMKHIPHNILYGWPYKDAVIELSKLANFHNSDLEQIDKGMLFSLIGPDRMNNIAPLSITDYDIKVKEEMVL